MYLNLDNPIAERTTKTVYRDADKTIKLFIENYSKADILNEALNQARVEEGTDLNVPKLIEVSKVENRWALVSEYIEGTPLNKLMEEHPEKEEEYLNLFVDTQLKILSHSVPLLNRIKDKFRRKLTLAKNIDDNTRYELLQRLEGMKNHSNLCHGDYNPSNVIVKDARYCMSYEEYVNDQWKTVEQLRRVTRTESQMKWSGGTLYRFNKMDKVFDKMLKKEAFAIDFNDTLYVNFYGLKHKGALLGTGYDKCYRMGKKIVITDRYVSKKKNMAIGALAGASGVFAGAIGGLAVGLADYGLQAKWEKEVCYIIDNDTKKITLIDQEMMSTLLADHPDLLSQYNQVESKKKKRSAITVMPLLIKAGLIKL